MHLQQPLALVACQARAAGCQAYCAFGVCCQVCHQLVWQWLAALAAVSAGSLRRCESWRMWCRHPLRRDARRDPLLLHCRWFLRNWRQPKCTAQHSVPRSCHCHRSQISSGVIRVSQHGLQWQCSSSVLCSHQIYRSTLRWTAIQCCVYLGTPTPAQNACDPVVCAAELQTVIHDCSCCSDCDLFQLCLDGLVDLPRVDRIIVM